MKTIFRSLGMGISLAASLAAGATVARAQDACADVDGQTAAYTKFTENFQKKTIAEKQAAMEAGKTFLEKYGTCETLKEQVDYIRPWVPRLETQIKDLRNREETGALFTKFDAAIKANNTAQIYSSGREILAKQPDNPNVIIVMGAAGLDEAIKGNTANLDESMRHARTALDYAKSGKPFPKKNPKGEDVAGAFQYEFTRPQAIDHMTFSLAYMNFYGKKDKKAGLPFYYELAQSSARFKNDPYVYAAMGEFYLDPIATLGKEIADLIAKGKAATTPEETTQIETQIKAKVAMFNGYLERALDAFGRAYTYAKADTPAGKTLKDNLLKQLQALYKSRFEKEDGLQDYIAQTISKPLPNPASEVTPISDPDPTTTTGAATTNAVPAGSASTNGTQAAKPAAAPAKPVAKKTGNR